MSMYHVWHFYFYSTIFHFEFISTRHNRSADLCEDMSFHVYSNVLAISAAFILWNQSKLYFQGCRLENICIFLLNTGWLAMTVTQQLLITHVHINTFKAASYMNTRFRTKTFQDSTSKHFNEYIFFSIIDIGIGSTKYTMQTFLFIFHRVSEPVQICNCYHLEARNVTGDRLATTNWNHYSPMSLVPVKIWLLRNVVSYCIQTCAPPNCPELL